MRARVEVHRLAVAQDAVPIPAFPIRLVLRADGLLHLVVTVQQLVQEVVDRRQLTTFAEFEPETVI